MKSEKGKPVFCDNVDEILADRIVEHTKKNIDNGDRETIDNSSFVPPQRNDCCMKMPKSKCVAMGIVLILFIAGIIAFSIVRPAHRGMKKLRFPGFFR
jgi:hypothetical protein